MPIHSRNHNPWPWIAVVATIMAALLWWPSANAQSGMRGPAKYKYAVIQFTGNDAIVHYDRGAQFYEGPETISEKRVEGNNNLRLVPIIQLTHLDSLGRQGWEVVRPWGSRGDSWLIQLRISD